MSIGERIRKIRSEKNISADALAGALNYTVSNISRIETGDKKQFTEDLLHKLADALSVDVVRLISDECEQSEGYAVNALKLKSPDATMNYPSSDVVSSVMSVEYSIEAGLSMFGGRPSSGIKVINMRGDSMSPTIEPGDLVFVDVTTQTFIGDGIYVFTNDDKVFLRRIQAMPGQFTVIADNSVYREWSLKSDDVKQCVILGKVLISQSFTVKRHG